MLSVLTKQIVDEVKDLFGVTDVYVDLTGTADEFIDIARRKLETVERLDDSLLVKIMNEPIVGLRFVSVKYSEDRGGFRNSLTEYTWVTQLNKYLALKVITVDVNYELRISSLFANQVLDLIPFFLQLNRKTEFVAILNSLIAIKIPVSLLINEIYDSVVDYVLRGKGVKVYRVGGNIEAKTFCFPVNIKGGHGEDLYRELWADVSSILYEPIREFNLKYNVGGHEFDGSCR